MIIKTPYQSLFDKVLRSLKILLSLFCNTPKEVSGNKETVLKLGI